MGKWVRIINMCIYIYTRVATSLNETKKGGETSKSKGWPTCIKSKGDKIGMAWS